MIALQAFGAPALLLVWLYVMANVIVFGAEINWWHSRGRREAVELEEAAGARLASLASRVNPWFPRGPLLAGGGVGLPFQEPPKVRVLPLGAPGLRSGKARLRPRIGSRGGDP